MIGHAASEQTIQIDRLYDVAMDPDSLLAWHIAKAGSRAADAAERQTDALELIAWRVQQLRTMLLSALTGILLGVTAGILIAWLS